MISREIEVYTHITIKMKVKYKDNLSMMNKDLFEHLSI